jgi:hypothetical protein
MQFRYPPRIYALVVMVCLMAAGWSLLRLTWAARFESGYNFNLQFQRLAPVREALGGAPRAGYYTNVGDRDVAFTKIYGPTQYVLAPTLLVPLKLDKQTTLVVGDFSRRDDYSAVGDDLGLQLKAEFPMGAVLYERKGLAPAEATSGEARSESEQQ